MTTPPLPTVGIPKFAVEMAGVPFFMGLFVQEWSKQERMIASLVATLEDRDYGTVVAELLDGSTGQFAKRVEVARKNLSPRHAAQAWIDRVLDTHVKMRSIRHDIIHGWWSSINAEQEFLLQRKVRHQSETIRTLSLAELVQQSKELQALGMTIINATRVAQGRPPIERVIVQQTSLVDLKRLAGPLGSPLLQPPSCPWFG